MVKLTINLFGPFQAHLDGQPLLGFRSDKVRALLAFLSVGSNRPWSRSYLADLLWSDHPEDSAQSNLSNALWNLRSVIEDIHNRSGFIIANRSTLQFNPNSDYWLDVASFYELIDASIKPRLSDQRLRLTNLEKALSLSHASFMEGFTFDSPPFETWLVKTRHEIHQKRIQALELTTSAHESLNNLPTALDYTFDWLTEEPWDERACRLAMQILVKLGQRKKALDQFKICRIRLAEDLGIEPQKETIQLYNRIQQDSFSPQLELLPLTTLSGKEKKLDPGLPPEYLTKAVLENLSPMPFFGHQAELNQLDLIFQEVIDRKGKFVCLTGEPGSGKTYLLHEFARRALKKHPDLLLLWGQCSAFTGRGDPYFPFLTVLQMLAGCFESLIPGQIISLEHLQTLWNCLPHMLQSLVDFGPDLLKIHFADSRQLSLARSHPAITSDLCHKLDTLLKLSSKTLTHQVAQNEQFTQVLTALSKDHPILLILDDLQWIDEGSASLLFHLGRQLAGKKILIIGAYRSEEVEIPQNDKPHPLQGILSELTAIYGKNCINLADSEGKQFINDLIKSEPNALTPSFHQMLYIHTNGHPLFTIELLRGMQLRKEIYRNSSGKWTESSHLNWEKLPARVEAVIGRRFNLLPPGCQPLMDAASVQGDVFNVEVLSRVLNKPFLEVFNLLSHEVHKRHRLIVPQGIQPLRNNHITSFRFRHVLFQIYLYNQLDQLEKARLHKLVGEQLEALYQPGLQEFPEMAHPLARHFELAALPEKAVHYYKLAGDNSLRLTAHNEAVHHFNHALSLLQTLPLSSQTDQLEFDLQLSLGPPLTALKGWGALEIEKAYDRAQALSEQIQDPSKLIPALFLLATFRLGRAEHLEVDRLVSRLVDLTRKINDPALLAMSYLQVSPLYQGKLLEAKRLLERASAVQDINLQRHLAHRFGMAPAAVAMCYLTNCLWLMGFPNQAQQLEQQAFEIAQKIEHPMTSCYIISRSCWLGLMKDKPFYLKQHIDQLYQVSQKYGFKNFELAALFFENYLKLFEVKDPVNTIDAMDNLLKKYAQTKTILNLTAFLLFFARACLVSGQRSRGLTTIDQCLLLGEQTYELWLQAESWRVKGELLLFNENQGQSTEQIKAEALHCFWNAHRIARSQKAKIWELRASMSIFALMRLQGDLPEAHKILQQSYQSFTEGLDTPDLQKAKSLLDSLI